MRNNANMGKSYTRIDTWNTVSMPMCMKQYSTFFSTVAVLTYNITVKYYHVK